MKNEFLTELSRALCEERFCVKAEEENNSLRVWKEIGHSCRVMENGSITFAAEDINDKACMELYHKVQPVVDRVKEYLQAMEQATPLKADGLDEAYKQLASFNGHVLAGKKMANGYGYQFAIWMQDKDRSGVSLGHYFMNGYEQAKTDFAMRTGLVPKEWLFSETQMVELYRCVEDTLTHGYDITDNTEKLLRSTQEQIAEAVPDFTDRIRAQQAHEEQAFSGLTEPTM